MQKRTKPVKKTAPFSRKPPKEVTLMIESKMLEQTLIKSDGRSSTKANIKHLQNSTDRISQKVTLSLKDLNLSQKIPSSSLRPSTSRDRLDAGMMAQRTSRSKHQEQQFPFKPFIGEKSRSLSNQRKLSGSKSCRHLKCSHEQNEIATPILNPLSHFKCFQRLLYRVTSYFECQKICWQFGRLGYGNILRLLHRLEYIQHPTEEQMVQSNQIQTLKKAYHFWLYISIDATAATLCNFLIMITAIEKIHVQPSEVSKAVGMFVNYLCRKSTSFQLDPVMQPQYRFIVRKPGCYLNEEGELNFYQGQLLKIPHEFRLFILNRLNNHNPIERESEHQPINSALSERSQRLADIKRRKMVEIIKNRKPHVSTVTLHDILNFKAEESSIFSNQIVSILNPIPKHQRISSQQLNFLSRPKRVIERDPIDLQFQRNEHECTFQPEIHEVRKVGNDTSMVKNANKSIQRMKEGRLFKKQKKKLIQSGWTNCYRKMSLRGTVISNKQNKVGSRRASTGNLNKYETLSTIQSRQMPRELPSKQIPYDESTHQMTEDEIVPMSQQTDSMTTLKTDRTEEKQLRIPLLFIDINIDETKKQRIVIYEQDSSDKLAEDFARRHSLDPEMQAKLRQLLEYQMSSILTKIQQEVEEQDNF